MTNELLWLAVFMQIIMGGTDTLLHHEFSERLAWQKSAKTELKLHALRNFIYAGLFMTYAWGLPKGMFAVITLSLINAEVLITLWDFVEEDLTRKLPATERVLHTLLALNYGAILVLLLPHIITHIAEPTAYAAVSYPYGSYLLSFAAIGVFLFGIRDYLAARRLENWDKGLAKELAADLKGRKSILITGATGFIGARLTKALADNGHNILVLTRNPEKAANLASPLTIITSLDQIKDEDPVDAIINLAGEPLANGLWTKNKKQKIISSRTGMINEIEKLCQRLYVPPKTIIIASAIGWYGLRGDERLNENSEAIDCFTHQVCNQLEQSAARLKTSHTRVVNLRIGLVLGTEGGMLANLLVPFEYALGGPIGDGNQWMSWIERDDMVRLIIHALKTKELEGPVNAVAPTPLRGKDFAKALGKALNRPSFMPMPAWLLKLGLGDFAKELLLASQRVESQKLQQSGFIFRANTIEQAFQICLPGKSENEK